MVVPDGDAQGRGVKLLIGKQAAVFHVRLTSPE